MKRDNSEKGFSLVEVMIALIVLLFGMLGIMGMQYYAVSGNATSRELRMATNLGQDMLESLKAGPFATISATSSNTDIPTVGVEISGGINFTRRWWVRANCLALNVTGSTNVCTNPVSTCTSSPDALLSPPVSAIRTRTCWTDKQGNNHAVTMDSVRWNANAYF
ncbi:hypothetical protein BMS3Abin09_00848 [bacterium BMS3Abin09]|nr:hypothetical protein BMS3Abin09_00848 [bacterium BMS3Abin09]GBE40627.1 hypothetical protein BMS3Bbin09_00513 [bacterium BMS3Bbin09]